MEDSNNSENIPLESEAILSDNNDSDENIKLLDNSLSIDTKKTKVPTPTADTPTATATAKYASELPSPRRIPPQPLLHFDTNDSIHQLEKKFEQRQSVDQQQRYDDDDNELLVNAIPSTIGGSLDKIIGTVIKGIGYLTKDPELVSSGQARILIGTAEIEQKRREKLEAANDAVATP